MLTQFFLTDLKFCCIGKQNFPSPKSLCNACTATHNLENLGTFLSWGEKGKDIVYSRDS